MNIFKQILKIVVILGILTSCQNKYKYVEIVDKESIKSRRKLSGWNDQYLIKVLSNI